MTAIVPVIDVGALRGGASDPDTAACIAAMDQACTETGFFVITRHDLGPRLDDVFTAARAFFAGTDEDKAAAAMVGNDGYLPPGSDRTGTKEMFDLGLESFDRWPAIDGFEEAMRRYQAAALEVAADVLRGLAIALGESPTFFADRMHDAQCFLRLIHAPALPAAAADDLSTGPHTDYGAITLLATDGVSGLEVKPVGQDWTPVTVPEGALVVNLGDMLARWTNDRYVSTPHRVVAQPDEDRYSVPFFVNPDPDTIVVTIPSCLADGEVARYEPITAGDFLQGRIDGTIASGDGTHG